MYRQRSLREINIRTTAFGGHHRTDRDAQRYGGSTQKMVAKWPITNCWARSQKAPRIDDFDCSTQEMSVEAQFLVETGTLSDLCNVTVLTKQSTGMHAFLCRQPRSLYNAWFVINILGACIIPRL